MRPTGRASFLPAWLQPARLRIALAFLREPRRWSAAAAAVAFGTVGLILADGFIEQIFRDFREDIVRSHYGHFQVLPAESARTHDGAPPTLPEVRERVQQALAAYPGALVAPRLAFAGLASHGERNVSFVGEGVEPEQERTMSKALIVEEGRNLGAIDAREAILGEGLARSLGLRVGDLLTLLVNTPGGGVNAVEVTVVGTFYTATKAYDDRALRIPLQTAMRLTRATGVSQLIAVLPDSGDADRAAQQVRQALGPEPVQVKPWHTLADFYNKTVELFSRQLAVVRAIVLAIVLLSISNSMARSVMERTREIGTMMALGATRRDVARRFIGEAAGVAVAGALVGVVAGALIAALVSAIGIPMPPPPGTARGYETGILFTARSAALAAGLSVGAALLAAALPAWRASRLRIVDALRSGR